MEASLRHRLGPIAAVVTIAMGIGFVAIVHAILTAFAQPEVVSTKAVQPVLNFDAGPRVGGDPPSLTQFSCFDPHLLPVWNELKKDTQFENWIGANAGVVNCSDVLEVKTVDLNGDGTGEFLIRGKDYRLCSAVGNCGFWIGERVGKRTRLLLSASDYTGGYEQLGVQVQRETAHSYSKILLKGHFSAAETAYTTYSFNGKNYFESRCMFEVPRDARQGDGSMEMITCDKFYARTNAAGER